MEMQRKGTSLVLNSVPVERVLKGIRINVVTRMSEKEQIFKKPFNNIFLIANFYVFFLGIAQPAETRF